MHGRYIILRIPTMIKLLTATGGRASFVVKLLNQAPVAVIW